MDTSAIAQAIVGLDVWFQSMRSPDGYCGPVSHWWESCLLYSGAKIDWRYEGILCGYVNLYKATNNCHWLKRALAAGDDVCRAQLPSGQFRNSSFQQGPIEGGTPHEAAIDVGLFELALLLRSLNDDRWQHYYHVAERNVHEYLIEQLWNGEAFLDQPWNQTLVPNKNATTIEALVLYEKLSGCSMERYIAGAAELVLSAQVHGTTVRQGATIHLGTGPHKLAIGIYTARCAAALVRLHEHQPHERYLRSAQLMGRFLLQSIAEPGTVFGFYPNGRTIVCPTWISPSGDVLRALLALRPYLDFDQGYLDQLVRWLLENQSPTGGIATAIGLGTKGNVQKYKGIPDFRDVLPVVGWCDKAFRGLSALVSPASLMEASSNMVNATAIPCTWKSRTCIYEEDALVMRLSDARLGKTMYMWRKGECYPNISLL